MKTYETPLKSLEESFIGDFSVKSIKFSKKVNEIIEDNFSHQKDL